MSNLRHVLIIDDDRELGTMLAEFLAGEGWQAELATDGDSGLVRATSGSFGAVILDRDAAEPQWF
jgi:DNA-binding response OmpR family regulator